MQEQRYPEAPPRPFVIVSAPRTGSTYLCTMLDSHPDVLCHTEPYRPDDMYHHQQTAQLGRWTVHQRRRRPFAFLSALWRVSSTQAPAVGFKLFPGHSFPVLSFLLAEPSVQVIILRRKHQLQAYVSLQQALKTEQWSIEDKNERKVKPAVTVVPEEFKQ